MSAVQALNLGYSPKHAAPPPLPRPDRPPRRRLGTLMLIVLGVALLSAGTGAVVILTAGGRHAGCRANAGCYSPAARGSLRVVIDSAPAYGLRRPVAMTVCRGTIWVADVRSHLVTAFGWAAGSAPRIWPGGGAGFAAAGAVTAGRCRLWIANSDSVTEMSTANGKVIRVIGGHSWADHPAALVLFGQQLWVANGPGGVARIDARSGQLISVLRGSQYGFDHPDGLAISGRKLWVANSGDGSGDGSVTELDAGTGKLLATLRGVRLGLHHPAAETASRTRLWVAGRTSGALSEIDTRTGRLVRTVSGRQPRLADPSSMALGSGKLWVASASGDSVAEFDAATGRLMARLAGPAYGLDQPSALIAYRGRVWITNRAAGTITELIPHVAQ